MTTANLTITISGGDVEDVRRAVLALAATLGGENIAAVRTSDETSEAQVDLTAPNRGRGRPRKDVESAGTGNTPAPTAEQEVEDAEILATAAAAETPAPVLDTANVVTDMAPAQARGESIKLMQAHYAKHPNCMLQITQLQAKYGVKMFSEVADDKAHAFLADVRLLIAGTPATA